MPLGSPFLGQESFPVRPIYNFVLVTDLFICYCMRCLILLIVKQSDGKKDKGVSETGVKFFNDLINELIANGQNNSNHILTLFFYL